MFRKGAMDLSLNTIVIVIFAIVVLGLGLALLNGLFGKVQEKTYSVLDKVDLKVQPTDSSPFVVSPTRFEVKKGSSGAVQIGALNTGQANTVLGISLSQSCETAPLSTNLPSSNGREVKSGDTAGWEFSLRVAQNAPVGDYPCTIILDGLDSKKYQDVNVLVR